MKQEQIKIVGAVIGLILALGITGWYFWPTPEAGSGRTAQITCTECGTVTTLPWSDVFKQGARNRMAGGWELKCPQCGTTNLVADEGEQPPARQHRHADEMPDDTR